MDDPVELGRANGEFPAGFKYHNDDIKSSCEIIVFLNESMYSN